MKKFLTIQALILTMIFVACQNKSDNPENLVVIVKYKAQPNKIIDAVDRIKLLIEDVKKEEHFVEIKLHIDPKDNSNILLYEVWEDESYYKNQHMKTDHLEKFIVDSQAFLMGPPEISFWKNNMTYK